MAAKIPKVLKNFNIMVDGFGCAGLCEEVELPELKKHEEKFRGAGMDAPVALDLGMEELNLKMSFAEHLEVIYRQFGLVDGNAVGVTFRAAKADDTSVVAIEVVARGSYSLIPASKVKAGEKGMLEATMALRYYRLTIGGAKLIEIDIEAGTRIINGVDQLASIRNAISI